ncbi:hypothetical protein [Acrocarpospora sp. B8E8]|uniref:hypothetical protein n=1 Tax=Acrocarpospora sp. B8E8 TaxID=3153572 RepID=UPI00325D0DFF
MTRGRLGLVAGAVAVITACGPTEGGGPLAASTLSRAVPSISAPKLADALPEPADFGDGWSIDTDTLGSDDYIYQLDLPQAGDCKDAGTWLSTTKPPSPHTISVNMNGPGGDYLWIRLAVDSPAAQADRLALIRAVHTRCSGWESKAGVSNAIVTYEKLDIPQIQAEEAWAVRVTSKEKDQDITSSEVWALARSGGLVVSLASQHGHDIRTLLPKAMAEARQELGL